MARRKQNRLWIIGGVVVAVLFAVFLLVMIGSDDETALEGALPVDESTLLVWGTTGSDTDTRRSCTIALLGSDGVLRNVAREDGTLRLVGVVGDLVWLDHSIRKLHARRLPDLAIVDGISEAVQQHAVLSHGYQVLGFRDDGAVLSGADGKRWRVAEDATIVRDDDARRLEPVGNLASAEPADGVAWAQALAVAKRIDTFVNPVVVGTGASSVPLELDAPRSFVVRTFDLYAGGRSQSVHRVSTDGSIAWSLGVDQLLDAVPLENQVATIVWIGRLDDGLTALVQLAEIHHDQEYGAYYRYTQKLVRIDAASGRIEDAHAITVDAVG